MLDVGGTPYLRRRTGCANELMCRRDEQRGMALGNAFVEATVPPAENEDGNHSSGTIQERRPID
jgi:hypothetical protein